MTIQTIRHGGSEYSLETLGNLSGPELVKLHNTCATKLGLPETKRFSDKSSALKRTWAMLQAYNSDTLGDNPEKPSNQRVAKALDESGVFAPFSVVAGTENGEASAPSEPSPAKPAGDMPTEESKMAAAKRKSPARAAKVEAPMRGFAEDAKIKILVKENPRRGEAAKRFEIYQNGMTVAEYTKKIGSRAEALVHLRWDVNKGHISVH